MVVVFRFALVSSVLGLPSTAFTQQVVEHPTATQIVENPMAANREVPVSDGPVQIGNAVQAARSVQPSYPVEGEFPVNSGVVVTEGVVYADGSYRTSSSAGQVSQVSYAAPTPAVKYRVCQTDGLLDVVNRKRRNSGLRPLSYDAHLSQIAQNKANLRANRRITGHDGLSRGPARVEGVGFAYGGNLTQRFNTCHMYSRGYSNAGAGIAFDSSGRAYYTLLLR